MKSIGFVILTWNSEKFIGNCLKSVLALDSGKFSVKIIVVDNGSDDSTVSEINKFLHIKRLPSDFTIELVKLDKNYGTTFSRNIAIKKFLSDPDIKYISILDSDTVVSTETYEKLCDIIDSDSGCAIVGPKIFLNGGAVQVSGRNIPTLKEKIFKVIPIKRLNEKALVLESSLREDGKGTVNVGYLISACWLMKKEIFSTVGLLDEKIFYAPEDAEFCIRCHLAGYSVKYCYDVSIFHEWQRLSKKNFFSIHNYEHIKGLIYIFLKYKYLLNTDKFNKPEIISGGNS